MKRAILIALAASISIPALAATEHLPLIRRLLAAREATTATATRAAFISGAKDGTVAFKRVHAEYDAWLVEQAAPPPSPPPAPPPVEVIPTPGLASIASNFDVDSELVPSKGTGAIPPSAAPDVVGAFRFICNAAQLSYDDPIVYPGQPGKSHLHQYFGNDAANANSTYASLRTSGNSTCNSPLNRSAYWQPAMLNGKGQVVRPDYVAVYYKRRPKTDPLCAKIGIACVDLPRGLRFVFGFNMLNPAALPTGSAYFNCAGTGGKQGHYPSIIEAAPNCPVGSQLGFIISAPECWDGKNLDSADHRSHVAYSKYIGQSYAQCPATHPYVIPTFTMGSWFTTDDTLDRSGVWDGTHNSWHLSSDEADAMWGMTMPIRKPGSSIHADWFGAWDDPVLAMWHGNCIDKLLNCDSGDLGNGKQLRMFSGFKWAANPRLVPVPARP